MKNKGRDLTKEHYQQLRQSSCEELWQQDVPRFNNASPRERLDQISVVRAVGVVFSESGNSLQKAEARQWLRGLLNDPEEKIRRYAMVALPKIGSGESEEADLLTLLKKSGSDRETKFLAQTLEKIGGAATLEISAKGDFKALEKTVQKLQANVARSEKPSEVKLQTVLQQTNGVQIHLRCRTGLESFIKGEFEDKPETLSRFRIIRTIPETVTIVPTTPFSLADLYSSRTFSTASFILGTVDCAKDKLPLDEFAAIIASPSTQQLLETFTEGPIRYRLEFLFKLGSGNTVRALADTIFAKAPKLLNDSRNAPWEITLHRIPRGYSVELSAKLRPDPRFAYRQGDVPAASHPPLAACLARLAGAQPNETVWDPFCGSGLELIERGLLGGVKYVFGTDLSPDAIQTAKANLAAALPPSVKSTFVCCDFRDYAKIRGLRNISLVVSNPPLGKRVPIPNLEGLIDDLIKAASDVLKPGGRLIFVNPFNKKNYDPSLKLQFRQKVDLGCFHCYVEQYQKLDIHAQSVEKPTPSRFYKDRKNPVGY
jgi:SAM-dependent methyltransferase